MRLDVIGNTEEERARSERRSKQGGKSRVTGPESQRLAIDREKSHADDCHQGGESDPRSGFSLFIGRLVDSFRDTEAEHEFP